MMLPRWLLFCYSLTFLSSQGLIVPWITTPPPFKFMLQNGSCPGALDPNYITGRRRMLCWTLERSTTTAWSAYEPQPEEKQITGLISRVIVPHLQMWQCNFEIMISRLVPNGLGLEGECKWRARRSCSSPMMPGLEEVAILQDIFPRSSKSSDSIL